MSAISGTRRQIKEMADGSLRVSIDIDPAFKAEFHRMFPEIDTPVALAPLVLNFEYGGAQAQAKIEIGKDDRPYSQQAKALRLSDFFRRPQVWRAIGSDEDFLKFVRTLPCVAKHLGNCGGDIVAAHVRRIADGAGTGIKPEYAAVPLCHAHHHAQHQYGENSLAVKELWDKWRIEVVQAWCWQALKEKLGHDSWTNVPPEELRGWALENNIQNFLPEDYRY